MLFAAPLDLQFDRFHWVANPVPHEQHLKGSDRRLAQWAVYQNGNIVKAMFGLVMAIADRLPLFDRLIEIG
jgi:hypothetical protein